MMLFSEGPTGKTELRPWEEKAIPWVAAGMLVLMLALWAFEAFAQTGTPQTKTQLNTETTTNFPDNTTGLITPLAVRQSMVDYIASWQQAARVNAQTGTTYNVVADDYGKLVTLTNASPVAVGLPQATGTFATFNVYLCNTGAGAVTITPTTSTINGAASVAISTNQCIQAVSDGTNYQIFPGTPPPATTFNQPAFTNCSLAASVASNLLTVALKDAAGNDPTGSSICQIGFRSTTATTGTVTVRQVSAALSVNTNATGATLGSVNNTAFRFWVVAFDNGGTVVLSLYNASNATSCKAINEGVVQSSTAFSGSATAAQTFYTPNGTTLTNKAVRILGYVEYNSTGLATAGTYASAPNFVHVLGSGDKKPCDQVQVVTATNSTQDNTTSTTFVVSAHANITITPASAANPILVETKTTCNKAVSSNIQIQQSRGNTNNTNMIGGLTVITFGAQAPCSVEAWDIPNTAAAQIYSLQQKGLDANTASTTSNGGITNMRATEIMG